MNIIALRKIGYCVSGGLFVLALIAIGVWGLNWGIDFTGGVVAEYNFAGDDRPATLGDFNAKIAEFDLPELQTQFVGDSGVVIRAREISTETREQILTKLNGGTIADNASTGSNISAQTITTLQVEEVRFEVIGPTVGTELRTKSIWAFILCLVGIMLYVAYAFRQVSFPVASWKYGLSAILALIHDIVITTGIFAILGKYWGYEINSLYIVAMLTILGYSINDTIVVFDRVRHELRYHQGEFESLVNTGLNRAFVRSLNSSLTVIIALSALYFFGGETIRSFILALIVGVVFGTYSSLFVASPLLVTFKKWAERKA